MKISDSKLTCSPERMLGLFHIGSIRNVRIVVLKQIVHRIADLVFQGSRKISSAIRAPMTAASISFSSSRAGGDEIPAVMLKTAAVSGTVKSKRTLKFFLKNFHVPQAKFFCKFLYPPEKLSGGSSPAFENIHTKCYSTNHPAPPASGERCGWPFRSVAGVVVLVIKIRVPRRWKGCRCRRPHIHR